MRIYNTLSGTKEVLERPKGALKLFVCGPTVNDDAHFGHARTYLSFDLFVRYLRSQGWNVDYLQNITDVDDKIIDRARSEHANPLTYATQVGKRFRGDMKKIGATSVDRFAPASNYIPAIIKQVQTLLHKGYAYKIEGSGYYFDISKFKDYGKLSHRTVLQAEDSTSRIDEDVKKKNRGDFALWKFPTNYVKENSVSKKVSRKPRVLGGEPLWETPLGLGRPGWHIEDTAITESFFGPQYDIHGGGIDIKFPHHEAEIAQQEAASGKVPFVRIWMHTGMVKIGGKKMSKSLGNFITVGDFLKDHSPDILRYIILAHHYRSPIDYTQSLAEQAKQNLEGIQTFFEKLIFISKKSKTASAPSVARLIKNAETKMEISLEDDFNTPMALAAFFEFMRAIEKIMWILSPSDAKKAAAFVQHTFKTFGFAFDTPKIPFKIRVLVRQRELSRVHKQFVQSDNLRKEIHRLGYILEDTSYGPFVRKAT